MRLHVSKLNREDTNRRVEKEERERERERHGKDTKEGG
jgi:hypothetical protein